jgi:3',5'-cyclic AMP phosphodiesterase CpdA
LGGRVEEWAGARKAHIPRILKELAGACPVKLLHFSDIHFGLEDPRAIAWAAECVAREKPDAVVITGDHTMRARRHEFAAAARWINALPAPVMVGVGNHDLPYFNLFERFTAPYRRFEGIEALIERKLDLGDLVIVPLKTTARAQPRFKWSKGWVSPESLELALAEIDALPEHARVLIAAHHPLVETGTQGTALTRHGHHALEELAKRPKVLGVLSGHVHDPFDLTAQTDFGPVRMIGAGTLSKRLRSTPPSFNELTIDGHTVTVRARNLLEVATRDMLIDEVPENALPPRLPGEPVAPIGHVPAVNPPVH